MNPHLQQNAPVDPAEEMRYTELQNLALDAARTGDDSFLNAVLEAGMPVNLADHKGNTLLMLAAYHGNPSTVDVLIRHGADVDRRNDRVQTPLGGVAFKGFAEIAEMLLRAGAEVNADQGNGMTPLMFATMFGRRDVAEVLKHAGGGAEHVSRVKRMLAGAMGAALRVWRGCGQQPAAA